MRYIKNKLKDIINLRSFIMFHLNPIIYKKDVFILGSAPDPNLSLYSKDKVLVTCNGSASNAKKLNLVTPKMTIVDNELIDESIAYSKPSRSVIVKNQLLKDLELGNLICVQSNHSRGSKPDILKAKYEKVYNINNHLRKMIMRNIINITWFEENDLSLASTGGFAIALCAFLKAKSITFEGFKLFQGETNDLKHFYESHESLPTIYKKLNSRPHSLADSLIIGSLVARGKKLYTNEIDFLPIINNWGKPNLEYKKSKL